MNRKSLVRVTCLLPLLVVVALNVKLVTAITWSTTLIRFTTDIFYDGQPAITQMDDRKIWLVWSKEVMANRSLYYKTSSDLGITWSDEMNLTVVPASGHDRNPSIIQAMNGTIWVVWISDRPRPQPPPLPDFNLTAVPTFLTIPQGGSDTSTITVTSLYDFSKTVMLSVSGVPQNVTATLDPTLVTPPPNGTATSTLTVSVEATATPGHHTLEVRAMGGKVIRTVDIDLEITPSGGSGESTLAHTLPSPSSSSSDAADGDMIDYEIFYKTSHDNGATWSDDIQLTNNIADDLRPSIVQLANGTIMLVWQSNLLGNADIFFMTSNGTSWSDAHQLTIDPDLDNAPHVTQTKDGKIWVVWASGRTGDHEIYYNTYDESWSTDTMLTYSGSSSRSDVTPSILQTIDDTMWIFWSSRTATSDNDIYYMCSSDNGTSWSDPPIQFTTDNNDDVWPTVTQTRDTKIWVVWTSNRGDQPDGNWDVYHKTSLAGDVNENGEVDIYDLSIVGMAYGKRKGYPGYNVEADLTRDGLVDSRDLAIICYYYGDT